MGVTTNRAETINDIYETFADWLDASMSNGKVLVPFNDALLVIWDDEDDEAAGFTLGVYDPVVWESGSGSFVAVDLPAVAAVVELIDTDLTELQPEGDGFVVWAQQWLLDFHGGVRFTM